MQNQHNAASLRLVMSLSVALLAAPSFVAAQPSASPNMPSTLSPIAPPATALAPPHSPAALMPSSVTVARPRVSQIVGARVYNDRDQRVGEVDDVLLMAAGPMAIVQVGGFLGIGGRLVSMPLADLRWNAEREHLILPGASKEALEARPAFEYGPQRSR